MSTDESGAPWPYPVLAPSNLHDEPPAAWDCPGGLCVCHPMDGDAERTEHRVLFFDHEAKRMPGARCRIIENGILINEDAPFADGAGGVTVEVLPHTRTLELEWCPADLPRTALYPFRRLYFRDVGESEEDGVRRRLHNIGFSAYGALEDNVRDYQRTYRKKETGRHQDIAGELCGYHDGGALPPVPPRGGSSPSAERVEATPAQHRLVQDGDEPTPATPQGGGASGGQAGGQVGGPQPQGSAAAIAATKLCIELHMAFALDPDDLAQDDDVTFPDGPPYDIPKLFRELYPSLPKRTWRFAQRGGRPVAGATLTIDELAIKATATTNAKGEALFDLSYPATTQNLIAVRVEPAAGELNTTGKPAGPGLTDAATKAPRMFRPFTLYLGLDPMGALLLDQCMIIDNSKPRFARVIEASKNAKKQIVRKVDKSGKVVTETISVDNLIVIDWKPDWFKADPENSEAERSLDDRDVRRNPFDRSLSKGTRLAQSPPGVLLHETSTHNLSFMSGFLKAKKRGGTGLSIHYLVDYDGFVLKTVDEHYRADHAGETVWRQRPALNHYTVGIETMHVDTTPPSVDGSKVSTPRRFTKEQYDALIRLLGELRSTFPIQRAMIVGHLDVKLSKNAVPAKPPGKTVDYHGTLQGKPTCPGPMFDWQRLEDAGLTLVPTVPPDDDLRIFPELKALYDTDKLDTRKPSAATLLLKQLLFDIGYAVTDQRKDRDELDDKFDGATEAAVLAFQRHYFSGRRRVYKLNGCGVLDQKKPKEGTLDRTTLRAIVGVWFDRSTPT